MLGPLEQAYAEDRNARPHEYVLRPPSRSCRCRYLQRRAGTTARNRQSQRMCSVPAMCAAEAALPGTNTALCGPPVRQTWLADRGRRRAGHGHRPAQGAPQALPWPPLLSKPAVSQWATGARQLRWATHCLGHHPTVLSLVPRWVSLRSSWGHVPALVSTWPITWLTTWVTPGAGA
jgi:hypothetical protein